MIWMVLVSGSCQPVGYEPVSDNARTVSFALADNEIRDVGESTGE